MVAIPKTPWSEIAASCHLEELLWRLVYIYGYKLFEGALLSDDCPFSLFSPFGLTLRYLRTGYASVSKPHFESATRFFGESGAALSPRRATYCLRPSASLRFAAGNLRCSVQPGSRANSLRSNKHEP